ncbi:hypothetical protein FQN52_004648 [Onygenales sp. PD_12]|nr:hypothetical protein FQN53_009609 [Emmonsiellopsis sp. PD_33]KAK2791732.1 hypothetical protein FQN52_004648 [Onygenales sp. PD_12]KAK2796959.1 hypothetical protein FQN51_008925 [Onygenales sp. PD_10]
MQFHNEEEHIHRLFNPAAHPYYSQIARFFPTQLVTYDEQKEYFQLQGSLPTAPETPHLDKFSLVVYIHGTCPKEGQPGARAAYGIFFGPRSIYNTSGLLQPSLPQTRVRADIEALVKTMEIVKSITDENISVQHVKIATDSDYLVNAMSISMNKRHRAGKVGASGQEVEFFDILTRVSNKMDEMEYGVDGGVDCQMWHITREDNLAAYELSNLALNGA